MTVFDVGQREVSILLTTVNFVFFRVPTRRWFLTFGTGCFGGWHGVGWRYREHQTDFGFGFAATGGDFA